VVESAMGGGYPAARNFRLTPVVPPSGPARESPLLPGAAALVAGPGIGQVGPPIGLVGRRDQVSG